MRDDITSPMGRLLTILIVSALLLGQGFSAAAAICHHRSAREHVLARASHDKAVAAVAFNEDSAASVAATKAASSGVGTANWVADLAAPSSFVPPGLAPDPLLPAVADGPALESISTAPPLRPPHA